MNIKDWKNPSSEYRSAPFWSFNGEMEPDILREHIRSMKQGGMGGFYMHSRPGLKTDYMGKKWMECVEACIDEAKKVGMKACLYDEDKYSSGTAGGMVAKEKLEYGSKIVILREVCPLGENETRLATFDIEWQDGWLISYCKNKDGAYAFDVVYEATKPWLTFSRNTDMGNPDAIDAFIRMCYDPYYEQFGKDFGDVIPYVFTDEVHIDWLENKWLISKADYREDTIAVAYWSQYLTEEFAKQNGYDLLDKLPELFYRRKGEMFSKVSYDYMMTLSRMFESAYCEKIGNWCAERHIGLTGHIQLAGFMSALLNGLPMQQLRHFAMPGVDILTDAIHKLSGVKLAASVANQYGRQRVCCEMYGATGWDWPLEKHKFHGDWQYALGINYRCQHLTHYTLAGIAKKDYPASISHHSPWWKYYPRIEDYFGRLSYALSRGVSCNHVLVIAPEENLFGYYDGLHMKDQSPIMAKTYEKADRWEQLTKCLIDNHILFDFSEEPILNELAVPGDGCIQMNAMSYDTVVLFPADTIRESTLQLLQDCGVKVIVIDAYPGMVDTKPTDRAEQVLRARENTILVADENELLKELPHTVRITDSGAENTHIWCQLRKIDHGYLLYTAANAFGYEGELSVSLDIQDMPKHVYLMDCGEGEIRKVADNPTFTWTMRAGESGLFYLTNEELAVTTETPALPEADASAALPQTFEYRLGEMNTLPLDHCRYRIDNEEFSPVMTVSQMEMQILKRYGLPSKKFYDSVQPWALYHLGLVDTGERGKLETEFVFDVKVVPETCYLALEYQPAFTVLINGKPIGKPVGKFIDDFILKFDISDMVKPGKNTVELSVTYRADIELENMYLIGDFGVYKKDVNGPCMPDNYELGVLPQQIEAGPVQGQGLDFYTGSLYYKLPAGIAAKTVCSDGAVCTCMALHKGDNTEIKAWGKYRFVVPGGQTDDDTWLEVIFGRKNLFGPLHMQVIDIVEPDDFDYGSHKWHDEYMVAPNSSGKIELK